MLPSAGWKEGGGSGWCLESGFIRYSNTVRSRECFCQEPIARIGHDGFSMGRGRGDSPLYQLKTDRPHSILKSPSHRRAWRVAVGAARPARRSQSVRAPPPVQRGNRYRARPTDAAECVATWPAVRRCCRVSAHDPRDSKPPAACRLGRICRGGGTAVHMRAPSRLSLNFRLECAHICPRSPATS